MTKAQKSQKRIEAAIQAVRAGGKECDVSPSLGLTYDERDVVRSQVGLGPVNRGSPLSDQANAAFRRARQKKADLATYDPLDTSFGGLNSED